MLSTKVVIGALCFLVALISGAIGSWQIWQLQAEISKRLPAFDVTMWTTRKLNELAALEKELLPSSRRFNNYIVCLALAFAFGITAAILLVMT